MSRRRKVIVPDALENDVIVHFDPNASTSVKTMATKSGHPIKAFFLFGIHLAEIACQEYRRGNCVLVVDTDGNVLRALRPPSTVH